MEVNRRFNTAKTATVRARVEPDLKNKTEHVFSELGLTATPAITLLYKQVELRNAMPFNLAIPNMTTLQIIEDTDNGRNLISSEDADELLKKPNI
ncbi:MAG: type II toxin-antitoxin system RelB/DinJ family antitoxin [Proteobacteria bacterium]|nr:type II toxin-antitoxin system RelB/DinJ family antitoxin [Pseudomonadota bacterium]